MTGTVILGLQWGDEGKGKIVDYLVDREPYYAVARFNGGPNAGHTVKVGDKTYKFHQLPSGVLQSDVVNVIGNGCVIDPAGLKQELDQLPMQPQLLISERAHVIMPWHPIIDRLEGQKRRGSLKETEKGSLPSSTTGKGIGPAYADKASRFGIRVDDLFDEKALLDKLLWLVPLKELYIQLFGEGPVFSPRELTEQLTAFGLRFGNDIGDSGVFLNQILKEGRKVLFEGAQSAHLDTDLGVYPYSTSSICVASGASSGTGASPKYLNEIVGVVKAYTSRSGDGAFPTELKGDDAEELRRFGQEYGTTTGKPRRVGWFDVPMVKSAVEMNGVDWLALTRMDTLTQYARSREMTKIPICVAYQCGPAITTRFPTMNSLGNWTPVYEYAQGYEEYIYYIEHLVGVPVRLVGTGPERNDIEIRESN